MGPNGVVDDLFRSAGQLQQTWAKAESAAAARRAKIQAALVKEIAFELQIKSDYVVTHTIIITYGAGKLEAPIKMVTGPVATGTIAVPVALGLRVSDLVEVSVLAHFTTRHREPGIRTYTAVSPRVVAHTTAGDVLLVADPNFASESSINEATVPVGEPWRVLPSYHPRHCP